MNLGNVLNGQVQETDLECIPIPVWPLILVQLDSDFAAK